MRTLEQKSATPEQLTRAWPQSARIIGLGNVLMGDDAFGPLVVERFRCKYAGASNVEILDLGTPGLDLAPYLYGAELVIIADCVQARAKPGRLRLFRESDIRSGCAELRLTGHDPGLQECLMQLRMAGRHPSELLIIGVEPEACDFAKPMSSAVISACSVAVDTIACLLADHGIDCSPRHAPIQPNLWWMPEANPKLCRPSWLHA